MKTLFKFIIIVTVTIIFIYGFSSSFISHNLENLAYVIGLGIDKNSEGDKKLKVSFQFLQLGALSDASSSETPTVVISTVPANSINEALNLMNTYIGKELNLAHCDIVVFSTDLAKDGIEDEIYSLVNSDNIRPTTNLVLSKATADSYLENVKPNIEKLITKYYDTFPMTSTFTGYTQNVTLGEFYNKLSSDSWDNTIALGEVFEPKSEQDSSGSQGGEGGSSGGSQGESSGGSQGESSGSSSSGNGSSTNQGSESGQTDNSIGVSGKRGTQNIGVGIFRNDKLIGELSGTDTIYHLLLINDIQSFTSSIPISKGNSDLSSQSTIDLTFYKKSNPKISVDTTGDTPTINIDISLNADILSIDSKSNYDDQYNLELLSFNAENYFNDNFNTYLNKVSKELKSDVDGFASFAKRNFLTENDWKQYDWQSKYENANFVVNTHVNVISSIY